MSDSTANAREPSMEDILASIRRIIDEEDTRDARPASDTAVDGADDGNDAAAGTPPVMAAAPVGRDDAARAAADGADDAAQDARGDAIFPERESLFWSRATGRGESPAGDDGAGDAEASDGPRTDIFRRAQSKLGSAGQRPGARERIQSLAARAEERAESVAHDRGSLAELAELTDADVETDAADGNDTAQDAPESPMAAFDEARSRAEAPQADDSDALASPFDLADDGTDVLDLTDPLDPIEPSGDDVAPRFDGLSDDEDRMDLARGDMHGDVPEDAGEAAPQDPESLRRIFASGEPEGDAHEDDAHEDGARGEDDVFDLTMPLTEDAATVDAGSVENGDDFHVSGIADGDEGGNAGQDIEDAITRNLESDDDDRDARNEDTARAQDETHDETPLNTYSRFDRETPVAEADAGPDDDAAIARRLMDDLATDDAATDDAATNEAATNEAAEYDAAATEDVVTGDLERADAMTGDVAAEEDTADTGPEDARPEDIGPEDAEMDEAGPEDTVADATVTEDAPADETVADAPVPDEIPDGPQNETPDETSGETEDRAAADRAEEEEDSDPTPDAYMAAFTMLDDQPPADAGPDTRSALLADDPDGLDDLDMGDELGFSDTFSASDVYHDDPPELDEDYSRSLEVEDEPVAAQGAQREEAPRDEGARDTGMEKVGGLVRDAMERDPVDYADPSALVSMTSEEISARALASLADIEGEASRRMFGSLRISDDDGSESLEGMVRGMLRPLLREWLDDNLPTMVESAVRGEVERISAKSRKYSRASDDD